MAGEAGGAPVRSGVAHRQRGGINALVRRLLRSLLADAAFTEGRVRVSTQSLRDKDDSNPHEGGGREGWGGERDFIDAFAAVSERISMTPDPVWRLIPDVCVCVCVRANPLASALVVGLTGHKLEQNFGPSQTSQRQKTCLSWI